MDDFFDTNKLQTRTHTNVTLIVVLVQQTNKKKRDRQRKEETDRNKRSNKPTRNIHKISRRLPFSRMFSTQTGLAAGWIDNIHDTCVDSFGRVGVGHCLEYGGVTDIVFRLF